VDCRCNTTYHGRDRDMKIEMSTSSNLLTLSNLTINEIEEIRQLVVKLNLKRELRDMYG